MDHYGTIRVRLSCRARGQAVCAGTAWLETQRKVRLGRSAFHIADGKTGVVSIRLSGRKQRLVRKHKLVRGLVIVEGGDETENGTTQTIEKSVTLRAAKRKNKQGAHRR